MTSPSTRQAASPDDRMIIHSLGVICMNVLAHMLVSIAAACCRDAEQEISSYHGQAALLVAMY
jgi:hypothetical protein